MNLDLLKKTQIVKKDEHFMPFVFVDSAIGGMIAAAAVGKASEKIKSCRKTVDRMFPNTSFAPIDNTKASLCLLTASINDVKL